MYETANRLYRGLSMTDVKAKHPAGVCSSFAMDWLKKKAANKPVNESTYTRDNGTLIHTSRLDKIVKRQRAYEKTGDLGREAESYGLVYTFSRGFHERFAGDLAAQFSEYQAALPAGLYYLSFQMERGEGHAIGIRQARRTILRCESWDLRI